MIDRNPGSGAENGPGCYRSDGVATYEQLKAIVVTVKIDLLKISLVPNKVLL